MIRSSPSTEVSNLIFDCSSPSKIVREISEISILNDTDCVGVSMVSIKGSLKDKVESSLTSRPE